MRAMILAAGRGERMRPLTDTTPKPLLKVGGRALIEHHIDALQQAGFNDIVINHAYLGEQIVQYLGTGERYGVRLHYSAESPHALDTGGGIFNALPLLGNAPFLVVNGDVWTDYPFTQLRDHKLSQLAHLVLVDNPEQHPQGDFTLIDKQVSMDTGTRLTFSGIGLYHPDLFQSCQKKQEKSFSLVPLLKNAMQQHQVSGEYYTGCWHDIGTPKRLIQLDKQLHSAI